MAFESVDVKRVLALRPRSLHETLSIIYEIEDLYEYSLENNVPDAEAKFNSAMLHLRYCYYIYGGKLDADAAIFMLAYEAHYPELALDRKVPKFILNFSFSDLEESIPSPPIDSDPVPSKRRKIRRVNTRRYTKARLNKKLFSILPFSNVQELELHPAGSNIPRVYRPYNDRVYSSSDPETFYKCRDCRDQFTCDLCEYEKLNNVCSCSRSGMCWSYHHDSTLKTYGYKVLCVTGDRLYKAARYFSAFVPECRIWRRKIYVYRQSEPERSEVQRLDRTAKKVLSRDLLRIGITKYSLLS